VEAHHRVGKNLLILRIPSPSGDWEDVTTFSPDELRRKLGDRTTSRLFFSVRVVFFQNTPSYAMLQKKKSGHTDPGTQN
jgi:hypothetical protein